MSSIDASSSGAFRWRPPLVAHRGYPDRFPENTPVGLEAAVNAGAPALEIDVQLSADHRPVVIHDDRLDRVSDRSGCVNDLPWSQLQSADVGEPGRFGTRFAGTHLSDLTGIVHLLNRWPERFVFVELKRESMRRFGRDAVVDAAMKDLRHLHDNWAVISSDAEMAAMAREAGAPAIGWVFREWSDDSRRRLETLAPEFAFCPERIVPAGSGVFWPGGWYWVVYGVNEPAQASELLENGANFIETDRIASMIAHFAASHG